MPLLWRAKRKVGRALGSAAMHADAKQTEFCTYLSAILLAGLLLNALFGLWWAILRRPSSWFPSLRKKESKDCRAKPARTVPDIALLQYSPQCNSGCCRMASAFRIKLPSATT